MDRYVRFARRAMCAAAACALGVLALAPTVHAQAVRGTLLGSIADTSGSAVPGATVTATDQGTSISSTTVTNQDGFYTFPNLKDGIYRVEASSPASRRWSARTSASTSTRRCAPTSRSKRAPSPKC
jgi:protocatechuate 3,4-dioxygenase beta subunit